MGSTACHAALSRSRPSRDRMRMPQWRERAIHVTEVEEVTMLDPDDYSVGPGTATSNIDLSKEEFVLQDGRRLTAELTEDLAARALDETRRRNLIPGRKSLSGDGKHSPTVEFRVPESLRTAVEERAAIEGISVSALARRALEQYLRASWRLHAPRPPWELQLSA